MNYKEFFPIFSRSINGKPLVYFDNAATTQKPARVVERIRQHYLFESANIHRGVHSLSQQATTFFEDAREAVRQFIHAASLEEIIFTKGTTQGINLVGESLSRSILKAGDEIIITAMEHHSNIVPWQMLAREHGYILKVLPMNTAGVLEISQLPGLITERTRLVSCVYVSNSLGTINPVSDIIRMAASHNVMTLVDAAQAVAHMPIDVQLLGCDFLVFSSHKLYGPTGVGVLYGKKQHLQRMEPVEGGGDMIKSVTFSHTEYSDLPGKFEAGTPNIAGVIGMHESLRFLIETGLSQIFDHESKMSVLLGEGLKSIPGLEFIGNSPKRAGVYSFIVPGIHPHDLATLLDMEGVAVRTGHHCTQPVMDFYNIPGTCRASLGMYNDEKDIHQLINALTKAIKMLS